MRTINKILLVIFVCAKNALNALPVQSKALENVDDNLFWEAAWFSEDGSARAASPFTSDSKRISPKSIFIIPEKTAASYCAPGYRIDDNGKCIRIVSVQQQTYEESKLAGLITTDDTATFDYDYWNEEDEGEEEGDTSLNIPLVPILNESGESAENTKKELVKETRGDEIISTSTAQPSSEISTSTQAGDFRHENQTDSVQVIIAPLAGDESAADTRNMTYELATSANEFSSDAEGATLASTTSTELNATTLGTDETIIETLNFDDVSLLRNESLLISYESVNGTGVDYDDVTTMEPLLLSTDIVSSTDASFAYEGSSDDSDAFSAPTTLDFDEKSTNGDRESDNKFVYQHLTTAATGKIKFPSDEDDGDHGNRVKFPDDGDAPQSTSAPPSPSTKFSWPRESHRHTTDIFQFWSQQPLIADTLQRFRGNSKSFRGSLFPYARNQKVQIVTPQQR